VARRPLLMIVGQIDGTLQVITVPSAPVSPQLHQPTGVRRAFCVSATPSVAPHTLWTRPS
jgi:hypothetical protein